MKRWSMGIILAAGTALFAQPDPALPPGQPLLAEAALPAYEKEIDHAGLIRGWSKGALARGRVIYQQICQSCHGDLHVPGSMPNSLSFGQGIFQHGKDPYTMYQTLTRGWRMMAPQVQLVPREKYDVIYYIRENFLREHNQGQWTETDDAYLDGLPKGSSRGPAPIKREPWLEMNYGDFLIGTFEIMTPHRRQVKPPAGSLPDYVAADANLAYKAIAVRLDGGEGGVARGRAWLAFEHDTLRLAGAWTGEGFIDWRGINFDGQHAVRPRTIGDLQVETSDVPGWANPATGDFVDARIRGLDGRPYGPLPRAWGQYRGLYRFGARTIISYRVGDAAILESHDLATVEPMVLTRTLNIGKSSRDLAFRVANRGAEFVILGGSAVSRQTEDGFEVVRIPAAVTPLNLAIVYGAAGATAKINQRAPADLRPFTQGGPAQWPTALETPVIRGVPHGAFAVDSFSLPPLVANPWKSWMRTTGIDFIPGTGAAVVCTWDGEVWRVDGIRGDSVAVKWTRIASGLFQPAGIKIVNGAVLVCCRDQIVRLRDLNGDGEADFYECFNSDHQVTDHFHEFAMGLQADAAGNLYYAKSARHARTALVPHHGTVLKVSPDGAKTEILANGFRAANGVCLNPDGSIIVTDQEGFWTPMNRINWVKPGKVRFYGNMWSYGAPADSSDAAMEPPLTWIDKNFDRSPAELLWVESAAWGPLNGKLINLSYGTGRIEIVPHESIGGTVQGGLMALPIPDFPTGVMRGRFHPENGHLYLTGMSAWATNKLDVPGGLYRIRATGQPAHVVTDLHATKAGIDLVFSDPLEVKSVADVANFNVTTWSLRRSEKYGSARLNVKRLEIAGVRLAEDRMKLTLLLPEIEPVQQMEIRYEVRGADGSVIKGTLENTIHVLGASSR
jgi:glucose/arabinose dehydrogenase/mono/diheme cytochrome c family protein